MTGNAADSGHGKYDHLRIAKNRPQYRFYYVGLGLVTCQSGPEGIPR